MIQNKNFAVTIYMTILYNYGDIDRNQIISLNNTNSRVGFHKKFKSRNKVKLNLKNRIIFGSHRSGWRYAIDSLEPIRDDINGFFVDDFIERTFSWGRPMVGLKKVNLGEKVWYIEHDDLRKCPAPKNIGMTHCVKVEKDLVIRWCQTDLKWVEWKCTDEEYSLLELAYRPPIYYQFPWIGFWHNPPDVRGYVNTDDILHCPHFIMQRREFRESLKFCRGLFVFSDTMAQWVRQQVSLMGLDILVSTIYHPTERVDNSLMFSFNKFVDNQNKRLLQIGTWLRDPSALFKLEKINMKKTWICGDKDGIERYCKYGPKYITDKIIQVKDNMIPNTYYRFISNVELVKLDNNEYDNILSNNIVFTRLMGSSCNNVIIECIIRAVPLLVNKLDAVVEYLGENYPFYYYSLNDASEKANNIPLIQMTHEYLLRLPLRKKLSGEEFMKSILNSEIVNNLIMEKPSCCLFNRKKKSEKIDFVITWVSNESLKWRVSYYRDTEHITNTISDANTINRYRNEFNELKYCIRSIDSACGDIMRKLYIVVHDDQEMPKWLNIKHKDIIIIRHKDIGLPHTYNSSAIETNLHKIKGISDKFVYLNDDVFLLGRWKMNDFTEKDKIVIYQSDHEEGKVMKNNGSFEWLWKNTHDILNNIFPHKKTEFKPILEHAPYVLTKSTLIELNKNPKINDTSHSIIRMKTDVGLVSGLSQYYELYNNNAVCKYAKVIYATPNEISKNKVCAITPEARVLSLQDDYTHQTSENIKNDVISTLDIVFNTPSRFE